MAMRRYRCGRRCWRGEKATKSLSTPLEGSDSGGAAVVHPCDVLMLDMVARGYDSLLYLTHVLAPSVVLERHQQRRTHLMEGIKCRALQHGHNLYGVAAAGLGRPVAHRSLQSL